MRTKRLRTGAGGGFEERGEAAVVCAGIVVADHVTPPLERLPAAGELVMVDRLVLNIGGCAANAAVDLAKMGVKSLVCGCVGQDGFGRFVVDALEAEGIDTRGIRRTGKYDTSQTLIVNVRDEDRRFIHTFGANRDFRAADLPMERILAAKVLYVGGYFAMPGLVEEELAPIFETCQKAGVKTVLDVVVPGPGEYMSRLKKLLRHTDVFLPNGDEARLMTGQSDPVRQAEAFRRAGAKTVVVTLGGEGAVLVSQRARLRAGVYPVEFVDGSGGGDAFDAGFIYGLLNGYGLRQCLEVASALGASCVRAVGTTAGVFTRTEAEAFTKQHQLTIEQIG